MMPMYIKRPVRPVVKTTLNTMSFMSKGVKSCGSCR